MFVLPLKPLPSSYLEMLLVTVSYPLRETMNTLRSGTIWFSVPKIGLTHIMPLVNAGVNGWMVGWMDG